MNTKGFKPYIPLGAGAICTLIMLRLVAADQNSVSTDQFFVEAPYFMVASFIACLAAPRKPIISGLLVLGGIYIGVAADMIFRSLMEKGYDGSLFPFAAVFIMVFALPGIFAISLAFLVAHFAQASIVKSQPSD